MIREQCQVLENKTFIKRRRLEIFILCTQPHTRMWVL